MEKVSWIQNGSNYRRVEGTIANVDSVPVGIYNVSFSPLAGWSLDYIAKKFEFPYKLYGLENNFINHVLKTFDNTNSNLGILLNGTKGTGKTVSAKTLANKFNLPVILVKSFGDNNSSLIEYLSSFNFDCVLFLDEFEKTWNSEDSSILQIMDGVYTSQYRKIFLLTTNETRINENLLSRPSRIRYFKEFGNLEKSVVLEYLKDNLKNSECIDCVCDFVDTLQISTIDILKTIVEDINIHGYDEFIKNKDFFNVKTAQYTYKVFRSNSFSEDYITANDLTMEAFLKEVKFQINHREPKPYEFSSPEEYRDARDEYNKLCDRRFNLVSYHIENNKSFKSLKLGDLFGYYNNEIIFQIDYSNKFIITRDKDDDMFYYYYVVNPDEKPSLYSSVVNPYFNF